MVSTDCETRYGTVGKDKNGSYGVEVLLDLGRNAPPVEFIPLYTASVGQPRDVEDANLGKRLHTPYPHN